MGDTGIYCCNEACKKAYEEMAKQLAKLKKELEEIDKRSKQAQVQAKAPPFVVRYIRDYDYDPSWDR